MRFFERVLHSFVAARFWIAPAFIALYYFQMYLPTLAGTGPVTSAISNLSIVILSIVLLAAISSNPLWITDYRSRLAGGLEYLQTHTYAPETASEILEQMRWSSTKLLGVVTLILATLSQYEAFLKVPQQHRIPILILVLLVLVSLFDAALDLEAEWTIAILAGIKNREAEGAGLAHAIWATNQFRPSQRRLLARLANTEPPYRIGVDEFTGGAKNIISFAIVIVAALAAIGIVLLVAQLKFVGQ